MLYGRGPVWGRLEVGLECGLERSLGSVPCAMFGCNKSNLPDYGWFGRIERSIN